MLFGGWLLSRSDVAPMPGLGTAAIHRSSGSGRRELCLEGSGSGCNGWSLGWDGLKGTLRASYGVLRSQWNGLILPGRCRLWLSYKGVCELKKVLLKKDVQHAMGNCHKSLGALQGCIRRIFFPPFHPLKYLQHIKTPKASGFYSLWVRLVVLQQGAINHKPQLDAAVKKSFENRKPLEPDTLLTPHSSR